MTNKTSHNRNPRSISAQRGQTFLPIMVFVGLVLLAMLGIAVDYSQVWAHRQMAQGAADAACQAGAADLYLNATDPGIAGTNGVGPLTWIGSTFDCSAKSGTPPCQYASLNGYTGSKVSVSFPSSLPNVKPLNGPFAVPSPYIQVTVTDNVSMSLSQLAGNSSTVQIKAVAGCGVLPVAVPVPLVILHRTAAGALSVSGNAGITVFGGPQRSIQIDSSSQTAASVGNVNLSQGGPGGTGSDFAVVGGPSNEPSGITLGSTGHYIYPSTPFGDPFVNVPTPGKPGNVGSVTPVPFRMNGCPDPNGCIEFTAGDYTGCTSSGNLAPGAQGCTLLPYKGNNPGFNVAGPAWGPNKTFAKGALIQPFPTAANNSGSLFIAQNAGTTGAAAPNWGVAFCAPQPDGTCTGGTTPVDGNIVWQNIGTVQFNRLNTGIFDPGLYYMGSTGLTLGSGSLVRLSTAAGDGSAGVMFYFSTAATISVVADSGSSARCASASFTAQNPNNCVVAYAIAGTVSTQATGYVQSPALRCAKGAANPGQVPNLLDGNILLGPCGNLGANDGISNQYGSPDGNRGFLFFQNRSVAAAPSWGGGGGFLSSGFMYFHSGSGSTCGSSKNGTTCLTLQGNAGANSYALGNIVTDELSLGGTPNINMILNPAATFQVLKPSLLE